MLDEKKEKCPLCKKNSAYVICEKKSNVKVNENLENRLSFTIYFCERCNDIMLKKSSLLEAFQISPYANIGSSTPGRQELYLSNEIEKSEEPNDIKEICALAKERAIALLGKTHTKNTPVAKSIIAYLKVNHSNLLE